jgi:hypothetical protein
MNGPPERESRPAVNRAADVSAGDLDASMVPPAGTSDAHCCGALSLSDLQECGRRGLFCGPGQCARRRLAERHADHEWRLASLTVAASELHEIGNGWLAAQLLDLRDLLSSGEIL